MCAWSPENTLCTSPSSGLTTWLHPTIANSAQNQRADEISGLICFDLSIGYVIDLFFKRVGSRHTKQITTVDHADIRGLVTTRLHYVVELAFL